MTTFHKDLTEAELHVPGYVSEADPGAIGAGRDWFQPSTGRVRRRNTANDGWLDLVTLPGFVSETDPGAVGAGMFWIHPTTGVVRIRNAADDGWVLVGRQGDAQADSTATDVAGIVADFNALLAKLRSVGIIAS